VPSLLARMMPASSSKVPSPGRSSSTLESSSPGSTIFLGSDSVIDITLTEVVFSLCLLLGKQGDVLKLMVYYVYKKRGYSSSLEIFICLL